MSQPPKPPPTLDYAPGDLNPPRFGTPFWAQLLLGLATAALTLALGIVLPLWREAFSGPEPMVLTGLLLVMALMALSFCLWTRWRWRGFFAGVLITFGLAIVGIGTCTAVMLDQLHRTRGFH